MAILGFESNKYCISSTMIFQILENSEHYIFVTWIHYNV